MAANKKVVPVKKVVKRTTVTPKLSMQKLHAENQILAEAIRSLEMQNGNRIPSIGALNTPTKQMTPIIDRFNETMRSYNDRTKDLLERIAGVASRFISVPKKEGSHTIEPGRTGQIIVKYWL
jgi:hypothetical protein